MQLQPGRRSDRPPWAPSHAILQPVPLPCSGILDARLLSWLPRGASVINAARGGHLMEADLLAALDSGHVRRGGGPGAGWISGSFLAGSCVFVCSVVLLGGVVDIGSLLAQRNLLVVEGLGHWQRAALLRAGSCPQCACAVEMLPGHRLANLHAAFWQMILPLTSPTSPPSPPACSLLLGTQPFAAALLHTACIAAPLHLPLPPAARPPQLASAILDVFATEPLPADSPLWAHPRVRIFPHVSSMTNIESAVEQMLQNRWARAEGSCATSEMWAPMLDGCAPAWRRARISWDPAMQLHVLLALGMQISSNTASCAAEPRRFNHSAGKSSGGLALTRSSHPGPSPSTLPLSTRLTRCTNAPRLACSAGSAC